MSTQLDKRLFDVDEYYRMARTGVLKPEDRVELIEGEIVRMSPIGPHAACVSRLDHVLQNLPNLKAIISVQNPLRLSQFSELMPDLAILKDRKDFYAGRHPGPADVYLVIEVSDTCLSSDRKIKVPLYARSGISEAWLVLLSKKIVVQCLDPFEGGYRESRKYSLGEVIASPSCPQVSLKLDDVFM